MDLVLSMMELSTCGVSLLKDLIEIMKIKLRVFYNYLNPSNYFRLICDYIEP